MIGKVLRGGGRRHSLRRFFIFGAYTSLAVLVLSTTPAAAQNPPLFANGFRWIGTIATGKTCTAPQGWIAERLLPTPNLPFGLGNFCLYTWSQIGQGVPPQSGDISALRNVSQNLTEDVPVVFPSAVPSPEEAFLTG